MSHIVKIQCQVKDPTAIQAACRRLGLAEPSHETVRLFSGQATGWTVQLPGWRYPAVFDTTTAEAKYDNFGGHWGAQSELDRFLQAYMVEKTRIESRRKGHTMTEQPLTDGSIKLSIQVAGGAA